jgi:hypothetical protein
MATVIMIIQIQLTSEYDDARSQQYEPLLIPRIEFRIPTMKLSLPYYLMYNGFYDLIVTAAATRHLIKSTGASFGVSEISRVLFYNNIHYVSLAVVSKHESCHLIILLLSQVLVVCTVNIGEAIVLYASPRGVPSMMHLSCAIQIITAMSECPFSSAMEVVADSPCRPTGH